MQKININKEDILKFDQSNIGKNKNFYFKRIKITGILLIMFSLLYLIYISVSNSTVLDYIIVIMSCLFGLYFIINSKRLKYKEVNKFKYSKKD